MEVELDDLKGPIQPKPFCDLHIPKVSLLLRLAILSHELSVCCRNSTLFLFFTTNYFLYYFYIILYFLQLILQERHSNLTPSCKTHSGFWTFLCLLPQFRNIWILNPSSHSLLKKHQGSSGRGKLPVGISQLDSISVCYLFVANLLFKQNSSGKV